MCVAWVHTPTRLITLGRTGGAQPLPNGHRGALPWDIPYFCKGQSNTLRTLLMLPWFNAMLTHAHHGIHNAILEFEGRVYWQ